ncbi:Crp/Fnr family transcriptional regulator [Methylobacterium dankookense]|nr:Crp/Fnr family transcriptional regulator [Methylobacterium dankookense]
MGMLIRKLESIAFLSEEERQAIQNLPIRVQALRARQDIVRDGDRPSQCCLVLEGWAVRYKLLSEGRRQILSFHIPGDIPDLQGLHLHTMDHSLATLTKATVAFIPHESLLDLTTRYPTLAGIFWRETLIDAAIFREWVTSMGRRSACERIAHLFCELYLRLEAVGLASEHRCEMLVTQIELSDALGLTSVHINRVLKDLRQRELITLKSRNLTIEAWNELTRTSDFDPTYLHQRRPVA